MHQCDDGVTCLVICHCSSSINNKMLQSFPTNADPPLSAQTQQNHSPPLPPPPPPSSPHCLQALAQISQQFKKQAQKQHEIAARLSAGTFSADKLVRLVSNIVKVVRSFQLLPNLRPAERLSAELGQLRRLLRVDRVCLVLRDYWTSAQKEKLAGKDLFMTAFRGVLLLEDCSDVVAYLLQLGVLQCKGLLGELRRRVADLYFLECVAWLLFHAYEWARAESEEGRRRSAIVVVRYLLDTATSHNDFSGRRCELSAKAVSVLGVVSSLLNLYLVWK